MSATNALITIPALLAHRAKDSSELEAIIDDSRSITYAELEQLTTERAAWLLAQGVNKNHRVGLLMPNSVDWAINAYAVMRLGAVLVPLSTFLRPAELKAQLETAAVRHLIACSEFRGRDFRRDIASIDRKQLPSLRNIWMQEALGNNADAKAVAVANALSEQVRPGNDMVIIFTSGSCGTPKGVIHTHGGALRANAAGLADRCIKPGERLYLPMPFFWVGGLAGGLISALNAGATLLTEAIPEPANTLAFLEKHKASLFRGWPDQAEQIKRNENFTYERLSSLKPGSLDALLPEERQIPSELRANLFGMTESFGPYCGHPLDQPLPQTKKGSCGKPFADIQLRVIPEKTVAPETGDTLPAGETGMIQLRGANMLRGICGKEREEIFTPDGWYTTGDMGRLDEDGYLYFAGRLDDMLKIKGVSVYPSEITAALESMKQVDRAFVCAVSNNGKEAIGAVLVPDAGGSIDIEAIQHACKEQLSAFKVPSLWKALHSAEDLPMLSSGKIDKVALAALFE